MHVATGGWAQLEAEARDAFAGPGRFPMRACSELMPGPFVGLKPYRPDRGRGDATACVTSDDHLDIDEYEQAHEVIPGVARVGRARARRARRPGPRSALYHTDGQVFSDVGIPVVLFMENHDISRSGYHDTHDTMANIDLDCCAALTAIAIESVADAACAPDGEI